MPRLLLAGLACIATALQLPAQAQRIGDVLVQPAATVSQPGRGALVDIAAAGHRLIAVGERGFIGLSDDGGKSWRQASVPVSVTLTSVCFATPQVGWAIGHSGVVLHTEDAGSSWHIQLDGKAAAELALQAARTQALQAGASGAALLKTAERLASDGPDKPFLGVHFSDARNGIIVGAYGLIFGTADGGASWQSWMDRIDNPKGLHLYAISSAGSTIFVAGEQGLLLRSRDGGQTFAHVETPYRGSYFALTVGSPDEVFVGGLNGNAYWSGDGGDTWAKVDVPVHDSLVVARRGIDTKVVLVGGNGGQLLLSHDGGHSFEALMAQAQAPLASFAELPSGGFITVGSRGAAQIVPEHHQHTEAKK